MDRWWDRRESSLAALGRVDSSDAVQGVGTAVLAYHGLSKAVLAPLAHMTLMDVSAVNKALHGLDIAPVAKALGNATEAEMGSASRRYGQLLADDIHATAIESTGRLITSLVQSGMPWPTAIDRASKVHGIPTDRLGKAGPALRVPVMQPLAADDIADRALMEYASRLGKSEATVQGVSKSERERFREEEVARDDKGRFADEQPKNALVALSRDGLDDAMERQRKREKKDKNARVMARKKSLAAHRVARKPKEVTLADIARARKQGTADTTNGSVKELTTGDADPAAERRAEAKANRLDAAKDARKDTRLAAAKAKRREESKNRLLDVLRNRKPVRDDEEFGDLLHNPVKPRGDGMYSGHVSGSKGQQKFMLLDVKLAEAAVKQGGFNYGTISASPHFYGGFDSRTGDEAMDRETLRDVIISRSFEPDVKGGRTFLDGLAIVVFDGDVANPAGFTGVFDEPLANAGTYTVAAIPSPHSSDPITGALSYDDAYGLSLRAYEDPGSRTSQKVDITLPHFVVHLDNGKAFTDDAEEVEKAWDETSVERDEAGKFADETRTVRTPEEKAAKRAKLLKRQRRMADIKARNAARKTPEVTLADIARAQQTRRSAARADAVPSRVEAESGTSERDLRMDAAREARVAAALDLRKERRSQDAKARRGVQSRERLAARLAAMNEVREEHHNEWKNLDALTFDSDMAYGTFIDMFGFDPYKGREIQAGRAVHGDVEHEYMLEDMMARVKPVAKVTEALHLRPPLSATGEGKPAWVEGETIESHSHWFDAFASAKEECDRQNAVLTSSRIAWKPLVKKNRKTGMFQPWMADASKVGEHIVVLGSRDDWNAVRAGADVQLVPLAGFDSDPKNPGQGSFDMLFNAVSDAGDYGSYSDSSERSDYFIRAFRIKT